MTSNEDLNPYIDDRIDKNITKFKKSQKWKKLSNKFNAIYDNLYSSLEIEEKKKLENLYAIFNDLSAEEQYIVYKIGFVDGIRLRDDLIISRQQNAEGT